MLYGLAETEEGLCSRVKTGKYCFVRTSKVVRLGEIFVSVKIRENLGYIVGVRSAVTTHRAAVVVSLEGHFCSLICIEVGSQLSTLIDAGYEEICESVCDLMFKRIENRHYRLREPITVPVEVNIRESLRKIK